MKPVNVILIGAMAAMVVGIVVLIILIINAPEPAPKVTEYKPQTSTTQKQDDEDDCSIAMCSAFGGGIVGDTLAIEFMNGD